MAKQKPAEVWKAIAAQRLEEPVVANALVMRKGLVERWS